MALKAIKNTTITERQAGLSTEGENGLVMQETDCMGSSEEIEVLHPEQRLKCKYSIQKECKRVRSLARIKVSAFGAGDRGFKSHRTRFSRDAFIMLRPVELFV